MLILDTDHLSEIDRDSEKGKRLKVRLRPHLDEAYITIVSAEELLGGWLALIRTTKAESTRIFAYAQFAKGIKALNDWAVLPWDEDTVATFDPLRKQSVRIGTLDLRIACIALAYDAILLSRNLRDFQQVPGLMVENWLD